jgi:hypothetical protein
VRSSAKRTISDRACCGRPSSGGLMPPTPSGALPPCPRIARSATAPCGGVYRFFGAIPMRVCPRGSAVCPARPCASLAARSSPPPFDLIGRACRGLAEGAQRIGELLFRRGYHLRPLGRTPPNSTNNLEGVQQPPSRLPPASGHPSGPPLRSLLYVVLALRCCLATSS